MTEATSDPQGPGQVFVSAYVIGLCVCTIIATALMKETRGSDLHTAGNN